MQVVVLNTHHPLEEDMDSDGLCDVCENELFGTNLRSADTDSDEIRDEIEDLKGDGITIFKNYTKQLF